MPIILLFVIYLIFISLGLPDGVLGSAWPAIYPELKVPVGLGGLVALIVTACTIISSLATSRLVQSLGIGRLLLISTFLTAFALFGYSQSHHIGWLMLFAIPLGFGAGAIDSALNNYVATHYKAHHMNWLHAFWGIGATLGPVIFALSLTRTQDWHNGFFNLGIIQAFIVAIILFTLPLWNKVHARKDADPNEGSVSLHINYQGLLKEKNVVLASISFLLYVGIEVGIGLWLASYLVEQQGVSVASVALWSGLYFGAITVGRIITGFISMRVDSKNMVRFGLILSLIGIVLLSMDLSLVISGIGLTLVGLGFAPIYPSLIHETPQIFGREKSDKVMSLQMVGGYLGATIIPPLIGLIANLTSFVAFAIIAPLVIGMLLVMTEMLNRNIRTT